MYINSPGGGADWNISTLENRLKQLYTYWCCNSSCKITSGKTQHNCKCSSPCLNEWRKMQTNLMKQTPPLPQNTNHSLLNLFLLTHLLNHQKVRSSKRKKKKKKSEQWLYLESILKTNPCVMGHGIKGHIWLHKRWNTFKLIQTQRGARVWEVVEIAEIDRRPRGRLSL